MLMLVKSYKVTIRFHYTFSPLLVICTAALNTILYVLSISASPINTHPNHFADFEWCSLPFPALSSTPPLFEKIIQLKNAKQQGFMAIFPLAEVVTWAGWGMCQPSPLTSSSPLPFEHPSLHRHVPFIQRKRAGPMQALSSASAAQCQSSRSSEGGGVGEVCMREEEGRGSISI